MEQTQSIGVTQLLAGLIIIVALHLVKDLAKMAWEAFKKKDEKTDLAVQAIGKVEHRIAMVERDMNEVLKFRNDFKRLFEAIKILAGDKWPEVSKKIREDDLSGD